MKQLDYIVISDFKRRIQDNETKEVIAALLNFVESMVPRVEYDNLIQISRRITLLEDKVRNKRITENRAEVEDVLINDALLYWLNKVYDKTQRESDFSIGFTNRVEVVAPPPGLGISVEQIIRSSELLSVAWLQNGLISCTPVCKMETPEKYGSGFMLKNGYLMTNFHILPSAEVAGKSGAIFNFEQDKAGQFSTLHTYNLDAQTWFGNKQLDFVVVKVQPTSDLGLNIKDWGALELSSNIPQADDYLTIIQHPQGQHKQIAFDRASAIQGNFLHYKVDTMGGSSGSPVFDLKWNVVALHHAKVIGEPANEGILISKILECIPKELKDAIV